MQNKGINRSRRVFCLLMSLCMICMVFAMPIVAHAAGYKVVTDDYGGMLSSQNIGKIEEYASTLKQYNVAVYIGYEDSATGDVVDKIAIKEYDRIFGTNDNGVLITIVFDEENYNTSIAVGDKVPLTGSQIDQVADLVYESYWDYDTDADWIVGSFKAVTEYFGKIEAKNPVQSEKPTTPPQPENNQGKEENVKPDTNVGADANKGDTANKKKGGAGVAVFAILSSIAAAGGAAGCVVLKKKENESDAELRKSEANRIALSAELDIANEVKQAQNAKIEGLEAWRDKVFLACPKIEDMIKDYEAKEEAKGFMNKYPDGLQEGRKSGYYAKLLNAYNGLSEAACAYVPFTLESLNGLYEKAMENEAREEARAFMAKYPSIDVAISSSGYEEITKLLKEYDELSYPAKTYVTYDMGALRAKQEECAKAYAQEAEAKLQGIYDTYPDAMDSKVYYDDGYDYYEALPPQVRYYIPDPFWTGYMARRSHIHRVHHEYHNPPRRPEPVRHDPPRTSSGYSGGSKRGSSGSSFGSGSGTRTSGSRPGSSSRPSTPRRSTPARTSTSRPSGGRRR